MRSVFLSLCLLGATCNGNGAQPEQPSLADEAIEELPEAPEPESEPEPDGTADEPAESSDPPGTDKGTPDTGTVKNLDNRLNQQLGEADNIIHVLRKDKE